MKNFILICITILECVLLFNCEPEDKVPSIHITGFDSVKDYYVNDTVKINYSIDHIGFDSICLYVNDSIYKTQITPERVFYFIPKKSGGNFLKLKVFYNSSHFSESRPILIQVYTLSKPGIKLICTRYDGNKTYFVGEKLIINAVPEWNEMLFNCIKQLTLFLNDEPLGSLNQGPYSFISPVITKEKNKVKIELIDTANHVYMLDFPLDVPTNTPPHLEFEFEHQNNIMPGYFYSLNPVTFSTSGNDNVFIHNFDYYLDNKQVATDSINADYIFFKELTIDTLKPGKHTAHCIAYDDRGDSTISTILDFVIYKTIDINDKIVDMEKTENPSIVYATSATKLYFINPESEEITRSIDLPFHNATSIDYISEENRLYLGFSDGHLIYYDELTGVFNTIINSELTNIEEVKIDPELNIALLISSNFILLLDLSTQEIIAGPSNVYGTTIIMDRINKVAVTGGKPGISRSSLFRLNYTANSLTLVHEKEFLLYIDKLVAKPGSSEFIIKENSRVYCTNYKSIDYKDFTEKGQYNCNQPQTACYSGNGKMFYIGNDLDKYILVYNTSNYSLMNSFYIPLTDYNDVEHITLNADNSKLVLSTTNVFYDEVKIIFVRL